MKGEDGDGYAVRRVPPPFGSCSLFYTVRKLILEAYANYNGQISYDKLTPSERDKPQMYAKDENSNPYAAAWFMLNLKGSYQINEMFQVNLGLENIHDKRYTPNPKESLRPEGTSSLP